VQSNGSRPIDANPPGVSVPEEPCPPWCTVVDHVEGEEHQSRGFEIASMFAPLGSGSGVDTAPYPGDLVVVLHRPVGGGTTWVYLGDGQRQGIELSIDSAARLLGSLQAILWPDEALPPARGQAA